jgi:hypothetical protein
MPSRSATTAAAAAATVEVLEAELVELVVLDDDALEALEAVLLVDESAACRAVSRDCRSLLNLEIAAPDDGGGPPGGGPPGGGPPAGGGPLPGGGGGALLDEALEEAAADVELALDAVAAAWVAAAINACSACQVDAPPEAAPTDPIDMAWRPA